MERDRFGTIADMLAFKKKLTCGRGSAGDHLGRIDAYLLLRVGRRLGRRRITSLCPTWWARIEVLVRTRIAGIVIDRVQAAGWC